MKLTFIIPHKEDAIVSRLLDSLKQQTSKNFEVIVIDATADRSHVEALKKSVRSLDSKILHIECKAGTARNIGAKIAKGDVLVFVDSDVVIANDFVEKLAQLFMEDTNLVAVGFPIHPTKINRVTTTVYRGLRIMNRFSYRYGRPRIPTTCAAYRRRIFQSEFFSDLIGEDILFSAAIMRLGDAKYAEHIVVFEEPRRWDEGTKILKNLWHYVPSYIIYFLTIVNLHRLLVPKQEAKITCRNAHAARS